MHPSLRHATFVLAATALLLGGCASIDLQGHRGARGLLPENTLPAFEKALELGVTTLELEVGLPRDGVLVISHDPRLDPKIASDARGQNVQEPSPALFSMNYDEVARHDVGRIQAGTDYAKTFATQTPLDGTRIPRLADLFALLDKRGAKQVRLNIETKFSPLKPAETATPEAMTQALIAALRTHQLTARATIQSFDWRTLHIVQRDAPEIGVVYLSAQQSWYDNIGAGRATKPATNDAAALPVVPPSATASPWTAGVHHRNAQGAPRSVAQMVAEASRGQAKVTWSPYFGDLTPALVKQAQALGQRVVVWTVNKPEDMHRLLDWGVDGIITDYPDRAVAVLKARGLRW